MPACVLVLKIWQAGGRLATRLSGPSSAARIYQAFFLLWYWWTGKDKKAVWPHGTWCIDRAYQKISSRAAHKLILSTQHTVFKATKLFQVYSYCGTCLIPQLGIGLVQSFCMASHRTRELKLPFLTFSLLSH